MANFCKSLYIPLVSNNVMANATTQEITQSEIRETNALIWDQAMGKYRISLTWEETEAIRNYARIMARVPGAMKLLEYKAITDKAIDYYRNQNE